MNDPIAYGPTGIPCGCGKDAHSNLVPCRADEMTAAVAEHGAMPMPVGTADLTAEQRATIAELIGDAKPATGRLLEQLAQSVRDRLAHDHATQREDWFCMNLTSFMGERMGPVLRRLLDAETRVAGLEAERHSTNESLSDAAEVLRRQTARITELEARLAEYERPADEDPIAFTLTEQTAEHCDHPNGYGPNGCAGCGEFRPADDEDDVTPQVNKLRQILAGQRDQAEAARAVHTKYPDSEHCQHDGEPWPCPTVAALGETGGA
jgi:hypothetical protein